MSWFFIFLSGTLKDNQYYYYYFSCSNNNREGSDYDFWLLDIRHRVVDFALLWIWSLHPGRNLGLLFLWLSHPRSNDKNLRTVQCASSSLCTASRWVWFHSAIISSWKPFSITKRPCVNKQREWTWHHSDPIPTATQVMVNDIQQIWRTYNFFRVTTVSAEIRIAKVALCNIALWAGMWTPYAAITLKVLLLFDLDRNVF